MKPPFGIRGISAEAGQRAQGFITIGETPSGPIQFPVVIVNGAGDGLVLCLTSGVHATEYAPIDAVMRIIQSLNPATLRGTVIAVPVVNMRMFESRTGFISPLDGLNLNKVAPGRVDGSISEILAKVLLEEVITRANVHIDLHAGDLGEMLLPFAGYALTGKRELDDKGEALARL
jgi:predicted deacylase